MNRLEGYYWIRMDDDWYVAEWESRVADIYYWLLPGSPMPFKDSEFDEINETRLKAPNE